MRHRRPHRALRERLPLRSYLLNAAAIGIAVLLTPVLTTSSATVAVPRPAEAVASAEPVQDQRFATEEPQAVPDRNATRDALDHDDTLAPPPPGKVAASNGSDFVSPVPGPITGGYGQRFHPILHYWRMHNGVDMRAACGTVVIAAYRGKVIQAGPNGGYGNLVVVDHGTYNGKQVISKYAHLSRIGVRVGDQVETAQGIALSGTTGLSTGCHLHFEIKENGSYVDPAPYLTGKSSPRPDGPIRDLGPTATPSPSSSPSPTPSTTKPSATPSPSPSTTRPTPTASPTASATPTTPPSTTAPTPTPSATPTPTPSRTTPAPTPSRTTPAPAPSETTPEPEPTSSKRTPEPTPSKTPAPSPTKSAAPDPAPTETADSTPDPSPDKPDRRSPSPTTTPGRSDEGSASPSPSPSTTAGAGGE